jgi:hypothetical protein
MAGASTDPRSAATTGDNSSELWAIACDHALRELPAGDVVRELLVANIVCDSVARDRLRRELAIGVNVRRDPILRFLLAFAATALGIERQLPAADLSVQAKVL